MCTIANSVRRFFHPAAIDEMLSTFVPLIDGTDLNVSPAAHTNSKTSRVKFEFSIESPLYAILSLDFPSSIPSPIIFTFPLPTLGVG